MENGLFHPKFTACPDVVTSKIVQLLEGGHCGAVTCRNGTEVVTLSYGDRLASAVSLAFPCRATAALSAGHGA